MTRKIILCPKIFNLYGKKDYKKSIDFLEQIEQSLHEEEIVISFAYCRELKAAAQVILFATIETLLSNSQVRITIRPSQRSKFVNNILDETGIIHLCKSRFHQNNLIRGELLMISSCDKQLIDEVTDFVIEKAYGNHATPEQERIIGAAISEAHYNVILHAYRGLTVPKKWWLRCSVLDDELYLIIYDQGIGFSKTFDEHHALFRQTDWVGALQEFIDRLGLDMDVSEMTNQDAFMYFQDHRESQIIYTAMADNETGMQGDLTERHGRGSKSIKALVGEHKNGKLWVFSNKGSYCYTDSDTPPVLLDYKESIKGTLIQWNIRL